MDDCLRFTTMPPMLLGGRTLLIPKRLMAVEVFGDFVLVICFAVEAFEE